VKAYLVMVEKIICTHHHGDIPKPCDPQHWSEWVKCKHAKSTTWALHHTVFSRPGGAKNMVTRTWSSAESVRNARLSYPGEVRAPTQTGHAYAIEIETADGIRITADANARYEHLENLVVEVGNRAQLAKATALILHKPKRKKKASK
jgi:hypothetical protein